MFKMDLSEKLIKLQKTKCDFGKRDDFKKSNSDLSKLVLTVKGAYEIAIIDINKVSLNINCSTEGVIKGRASSQNLSVGKESAPKIVALKQIADNIYKSEVNHNPKVVVSIENKRSKLDNNLHKLEDFSKDTMHFIKNFEHLIKNFQKQHEPDETESSTDISGFLEKNVVSSSPISK